MFDCTMPASFQYVYEAVYITVDITVWVFKAVTYICLCGKVTDAVKLFFRKQGK